MIARSSQEVTELLLAWRDGNEAALEKLLPLVYDELHRLASALKDGPADGRYR
jgi:hypothetical protein